MENTFYIKHKYQPIVFVPLIAVRRNVDFLFWDKKNGERFVVTTDNVKCKVGNVAEVNILDDESEALVKELYSLDLLTFLKKWRHADRSMDSLTFLKITLKKIE